MHVLRWSIPGVFATLFLAEIAGAQIIGVEPADEKAAARLSKWTVEFKGRAMICGEVLSGLEFDREKNVIRKPANANQIVMVVPDPAKPELELTGSNRDGTTRLLAPHRKLTLEIREVKSSAYHLVFPHQTLAGLRSEYLRKKAGLDALRSELKGQKLGSREWFEAHRRLTVELDALASWLRSTLFPAAAKQLEKEAMAELKRQGDAASQSRLETAKKSLKTANIPERLNEKSREFGRGDLKWHGCETDHFRIVSYTDGFSQSQMEAGLLFAETIFESFRVTFIDPYLGTEEADPVPDRMLAEWFFCPEDIDLAARFYEDYYGKRLGNPREKTIRVQGHRAFNGNGTDHLHFWRFNSSDLEGTIAHDLGHDLARLAYNGSSQRNMPDWISEGFGYWISFNFLSRNTVNCVAFSTPTYGRSADKEGAKPTGQGLRAAFNDLALDKGPSLDRLFQLKLVEMEAGDIAKAWSFLEFLIEMHPDAMNEFLKVSCQTAGRDGKTELESVRELLERLFDKQNRDVFTSLNDLWRRYAATGQKSEKKKR